MTTTARTTLPLLIVVLGVGYAVYQGQLFGTRAKQSLIPPQIEPSSFVLPHTLNVQWPHFYINQFVSSRGYNLATYRWLPEDVHPDSKGTPPKALVFLWNGFTDHADNIGFLARDLAKRGYAAFSMDFEGTGRSEGLPGYIHSFNQTASDASRYVDQIQQEFQLKYNNNNNNNNMKTFMIGPSMGGLISVMLSLENHHKYAGMVLVAPAIKADENLYPFLRKIARLLAMLVPEWGIADKLNEQAPICKDPHVAYYYDNVDAKMYKGKFRAQTGVAFLDAFEYLSHNLDHVQTPMLIMHGEADKITTPQDSKLLYQKAKSTDKTLRMLKDEWHDFLHDVNICDTYLEEIYDWIDQRSK